MATNRRARGAWPRKRKLSMQIRPKVCLELGEWESLAEIASWEHTTVASLVRKQTANTNMPRDIKKALREFVVDYLRKRAARLLGH